MQNTNNLTIVPPPAETFAAPESNSAGQLHSPSANTAVQPDRMPEPNSDTPNDSGVPGNGGQPNGARRRRLSIFGRLLSPSTAAPSNTAVSPTSAAPLSGAQFSLILPGGDYSSADNTSGPPPTQETHELATNTSSEPGSAENAESGGGAGSVPLEVQVGALRTVNAQLHLQITFLRRQVAQLKATGSSLSADNRGLQTSLQEHSQRHLELLRMLDDMNSSNTRGRERLHTAAETATAWIRSQKAHCARALDVVAPGDQMWAFRQHNRELLQKLEAAIKEMVSVAEASLRPIPTVPTAGSTQAAQAPPPPWTPRAAR